MYQSTNQSIHPSVDPSIDAALAQVHGASAGDDDGEGLLVGVGQRMRSDLHLRQRMVYVCMVVELMGWWVR